jgi:AraC family transcriptional regulator
MAAHVISVLREGRLRPALPNPPLLSSKSSLWQGFQLEQYQVEASEMPTHTNPSYFVVLQEGETPVEIDSWIDHGSSRRVTRTDGEIGLRTLGELAGWRWNGCGALLVLAVDPLTIQRLAEECGQGRAVELVNEPARRDPIIRHLMLAMRSELQRECPAGRLLGECIGTAITIHLLKHCSVFPPPMKEYRGGISRDRLRRVLDHINNHLDEDLGIEALARIGLMSPYYFGKLFKQSMGQTVHRYVLDQRIERAKQLLTDSRRTLVEVGLSVGMANQSHFTTLFRRKVGITPGVYKTRFSAVRHFCS